MIINKSLRAKMSLQDGATVKIVEKITRINAKMCGFLWRYSTRHLINFMLGKAVSVQQFRVGPFGG